jgi:DNA ligase (NAD+)
MDIEGLGEALVRNLVTSGLVRNFADLYDLTPERLESLARMGKKSARNIIDALEKSKTRRLEHLIYALGIRHVGVEAARLLALSFGSMDALVQARFPDLVNFEGIGPVVAESILAFFGNPDNCDVLKRLRRAGLPFTAEKPAPVPEQGFFSGRTVVLTGELATMTRQEASERIRLLGGKVTSSVSRNTDYVIVGANPGSKYDKARELGITVLTEDEFRARFG